MGFNYCNRFLFSREVWRPWVWERYASWGETHCINIKRRVWGGVLRGMGIQELSPILLFRRHPLCCFCDPLCCFCVPLCWSVCPFCWFGDPFCCFCSTKKQQSGNLQSPNARGGTECWFCIWVESTFLVIQKPRIYDSCWSTFLVVKKQNRQFLSIKIELTKIWVAESTFLALQNPRIIESCRSNKETTILA